jgi:hypothetical protein
MRPRVVFLYPGPAQRLHDASPGACSLRYPQKPPPHSPKVAGQAGAKDRSCSRLAWLLLGP